MINDNNLEKKPKKKIATGYKQKTTKVEQALEDDIQTNKNEVVLKADGKVDRVYFISDIHIKNKDDLDHIYYHVFDNLFVELEKDKINENDLIVVLGDILDSGENITSSGIVLLKYLYKGISKYCNTISILGNHDLRGIRENKKDVITSIVQDKNLGCNYTNYFLLDDKIYLYGNIAFGHTKFTTNIVTDCSKYNDKYVTIGLFHGSINGSKFDNHQVVSGQQFSMKDFKNYKFVGCGDLHTQQWLRQDHTAFYPSSLLQHKVNEGLNHGMVKLDMHTSKCEFIKINNKYKTIDLQIDDDGNIINYDFDKHKDTEYANLQITYGKHSDKMIEKIKQKFNDNGIVVTDFKRKPNFGLLKIDSKVEVNGKEFNLSNIKTKNDLIEFFNSYILEKHTLDNQDKFKQYNSELINDALTNDDLLTEKVVNVLNIKMHNLMIYGENTSLNVKSINGILGVCQSNSFGKSSLCESLSLIVCGMTPRCSCAKSFIRKGQQTGYGTVTLTINDTEYEITRTFKCHGKNSSMNADVTLELKKCTGLKINDYVVYSSDKRQAEKYSSYVYTPLKEIQSMIDELLVYEEIYSMLIVSQDRENSFLKTKDKVGILFKVTNLGYIDKISQKCVGELTQLRKNMTSTIKKYIPEELLVGFSSKNGDTGIKYIEHIKNKIAELEIQISNTLIDDNYNDIFEDYESQKKDIMKYEETLKLYKEFSNVTTNTDQIKQNILIFEEELEQNQISIDFHTNEKTQMQNIVVEQNKKIEKYGDIEKRYVEFKNEKQKTINQNKLSIEKLKKQIKYCNEIKQKDLIIAQNELEKNTNDLEKINDKICVLNKKIVLYTDIKKVFENYKNYLIYESEKIVCDKFVELCEKLKIKDKNLQVELLKIKAQKNILEEQLNKYADYKVAYDEYDPNVDLVKERHDMYEQQNFLKNGIKKCEQIIEMYDTYQKNLKLQDQIKMLEQENEVCKNSQLENYDEYLNLVNITQTSVQKINQMSITIDKLSNRNDKLNNLIEKEKYTLEMIENNIEKYNIYNEIKKEYEIYLKYHKQMKNDFEKIQKQKNENDAKNKKMENQINVAKNILEKCLNDVDKLNCYEIINTSLKNNGLYDILIQKIVDNLQNAIDQMTEFIGHEKINVTLVKGGKYDIVINTEKIPDIANAGGFQSKIMELLFKMAFLKINSYFKSDFIIIDEIYDACSEENKPMAIKLVEFFKLNYKKMMVVSHNPSIIELFDSRLTINYDQINGNSLVQ